MVDCEMVSVHRAVALAKYVLSNFEANSETSGERSMVQVGISRCGMAGIIRVGY